MSRRNRRLPSWTPGEDTGFSGVRSSSVRTPTAAVAALLVSVVGARLALAAANNAPGTLPAELAAAHDLVRTAGPTGIGALVVGLSVVHREGSIRAGLAFAGVFGLLGLHVPAAALPAVLAVVAGTVVVVLGAGRSGASARTVAVGATLWLGLALSLSSATGVADASLRSVGSLVGLVGVAALPLVTRPGRGGWLAGAAAAGLVGWVGTAAPFVSGAVLLAGFGVVGVPLLVVAAAAGGGVAGLAGGLSRERWHGAFGITLLVLAGVPATISAALAAGAGLALLLGGEPS